MRTVLVAEDESTIRDFIVINLKIAGFDVIEACNGAKAIELYDTYSDNIDIALLDVMMPEATGHDVCKHIRENNANVGVIFLTAKTQEQDIIGGFKFGADDYITKPFSPSELVARIETLYRRVEYSKKLMKSSQNDKIRLGNFELDLKKHCVSNKGEVIELTQIEFQVLECFFNEPGKAIDRKYILNKVWGDPYFGDDKVVDVNIRRLRLKLEECPSNPRHLITIWGQGYCWKE